jgi:uncharacterized protein
MKITDTIHGEFVIEDPVLIELINSQPFQRLKGVQQLGMQPGWSDVEGFSRFEHSIGVMLLLRKLGAPLKEQIAGLLHDISHTVFSHVIDYIYKTEKGNFQDMILEKYMEEYGISEILAKYGFDHKEISKIETFTLLDKDIPNLCVDRIDYCLRELFHNNKSQIAFECANSLCNFGGDIVFKDKEIAKLFAHNYLDRQLSSWSAATNVGVYSILSAVLKRGLKTNILNYDDLFTEDSLVLKKLLDSGDSKIVSSIKQLYAGIKCEFVSEDKSNIAHSVNKFRYVDPLYLDGLETFRLSEEDGEYAYLVADCKKRFKKGLYVRLG